MSDRKQDHMRKTNQQAAQADSERGTQPPEASVGREVGQRTPERAEREQVRNAGVKDVNDEDTTVPELAPNQTTGGPAELDRVPTGDKS